MRTLAVIPARGGSKRLPGKNIRRLGGKPLIAWTIDFAKSVTWFDEIQVSTDSPEIAAICSEYGLTVRRLRPPELATDEASSLDVVLDLLACRRAEGVEFDAVALLQPTTPVRLMQRWDTARGLLNGDCEGVVGVSPTETQPFLIFRDSADGYMEPWMPNPGGITRSQDYPPAYTVNGAIYLTRVDALMEQRTFFPRKSRGVLCTNPLENIDIDTPLDWQMAEHAIVESGILLSV